MEKILVYSVTWCCECGGHAENNIHQQVTRCSEKKSSNRTFSPKTHFNKNISNRISKYFSKSKHRNYLFNRETKFFSFVIYRHCKYVTLSTHLLLQLVNIRDEFMWRQLHLHPPLTNCPTAPPVMIPQHHHLLPPSITTCCSHSLHVCILACLYTTHPPPALAFPSTVWFTPGPRPPQETELLVSTSSTGTQRPSSCFLSSLGLLLRTHRSNPVTMVIKLSLSFSVQSLVCWILLSEYHRWVFRSIFIYGYSFSCSWISFFALFIYFLFLFDL